MVSAGSIRFGMARIVCSGACSAVHSHDLSCILRAFFEVFYMVQLFQCSSTFCQYVLFPIDVFDSVRHFFYEGHSLCCEDASFLFDSFLFP